MKSLLWPLLTIFAEGAARASDLVSYYFPESEQCTLVLDFQPRRQELVQLSKEACSLVSERFTERIQGERKMFGCSRSSFLARTITADRTSAAA